MNKYVFLAVLFALGTSAQADCHFKSSRAIMCLSPQNAMQAFQRFGPNNPKADTKAFREYLNNYGCITAAEIPEQVKEYPSSFWDNKKIYGQGAYKVPTPDGYTLIDSLMIGGSGFYTEHSQLVGKCAVYRATTTTIKP